MRPLKIPKETGYEAIPIIERFRRAVKAAATERGLLHAPVTVKIKRLPPESAIGSTPEKDYPIWKGKEGIVEARLLNGVGQAFSPGPDDFSGQLVDVLNLDLDGIDHAAVRNRGLFVASANALCSHLGVADKTIHCRNEGPRECAQDLIGVLRANLHDHSRITLIGCQPRMIEAIASAYCLRVIDLDPDNIGKSFGSVIVEGQEKTDEALEWCDIALVTGSTIVNGTIDRFIGLKCRTLFYGVTIAGAAALLRLQRFCTRAMCLTE